MKRIKYMLAAALVALTLGVVHQESDRSSASLPRYNACPPYCNRAVAEGPIDEPPPTRPGVQASGSLAEGLAITFEEVIVSGY